MLKIFTLFDSFISNTDPKYRVHKIITLITVIIVSSFYFVSEYKEKKLLSEKNYTIVKRGNVYLINIQDKKYIGEFNEWYEVVDTTNQIKLIHDEDIIENLDTKVKRESFKKILIK
jgi:hypothetical protein